MRLPDCATRVSNMLFRLVRPVRRKGSRNPYFVRRIPSDVRGRAIGLKLAIPIGERTQLHVISPFAQSVRVSLRTDNPADVKARQAAVDFYLENVWRALREDAPVSLTHKQATALAGQIYLAWASGNGRERTTAMEHVPGIGWRRAESLDFKPEEWDALLRRWDRIDTIGKHTIDDPPQRRMPFDLDNPKPTEPEEPDPSNIEKHLGAVVDRLLLSKGIKQLTPGTRELVLSAFWQALRDAFENRKRNAEGDYSPDPISRRFPEWTPLVSKSAAPSVPQTSLTALVEAWWAEAKATGRKKSTYESYRNTMAAFVQHLGHDDAGRITKDDVIGFKNHRLASINPRNGRPISAKTVKDSDLAGLKTIFGWAVAEGRLPVNPAYGVTIKLGRPRKLRRACVDG